MTTTTNNMHHNMQTVILKVGLHCDGCERRVKKAIWHLKGITSVDVDDNRERITVSGFVDPARILKAVKKTGKPVELWKYQNGNKNLYGSQPLASTTSAPAKLSNASSKGNKVHNHNQNSNSNKYPGFQHTGNKKLSSDRSQHPQPEYFSEDDSEFESFPDTEFYGLSDNKSDPYAQFKTPKSGQKNDFYSDFKSPKNQKNNTHNHNHNNTHNHNHTHSEFKSPKNQKNDFYGNFKSPKNQKNDPYSDFKSPNTQQKSSDFYDDVEFKPSKNQKPGTTTAYNEFKPGKNHQNHHNSDYYGGSFKSPKEHQQKPGKQNLHEFTYDDESEFTRKPKSSNQGHVGGGYDVTSEKLTQNHKSNASKNYDDYDCGNHSPPYSEFKNSASSTYNINSNGHQHQKFQHSEFDSEEKPFNQKKPKSQVPAKYVSFEDEYEPSYHHRPQPEVVSGIRATQPQESRGHHEQRFYTTYGHEQSYNPSYTYHESHRIPATSGFTNMFSEENPNACSIM